MSNAIRCILINSQCSLAHMWKNTMNQRPSIDDFILTSLRAWFQAFYIHLRRVLVRIQVMKDGGLDSWSGDLVNG